MNQAHVLTPASSSTAPQPGSPNPPVHRPAIHRPAGAQDRTARADENRRIGINRPRAILQPPRKTTMHAAKTSLLCLGQIEVRKESPAPIERSRISGCSILLNHPTNRNPAGRTPAQRSLTETKDQCLEVIKYQLFLPPYRRTRRSACSLWPEKFSIAHKREQYSPIIAVASGLTC
jgi:hypothetical protein